MAKKKPPKTWMSPTPIRGKSPLSATIKVDLDAKAKKLVKNVRNPRYVTPPPKDAMFTCIYGEITVLATHPAIYYCGVNWHPGEPAGGYCGIQHNSERERRTVFSIWDTTPELHPNVTAANPGAIFNRFGGEGTGAHTHMLWPWKVGDAFQFFVHKQPGQKPDTTDARYYIYDRSQEKWLHSATITCPIGGKKSEASAQYQRGQG